MRLTGIQQFLKERHLPFQYWEDDDCGSIEFDHRGLHYHIWEFPKPERGAQSNVRIAGRSEEFGDNYEEVILEILKEFVYTRKIESFAHIVGTYLRKQMEQD